MKKRIAIFNDFQRPIPPVNGGSVPNLINMLLLENEEKQKFDIDVYVCENKQAREEAKHYKHTRFIFVKDAGLIRFMTNVAFKLKLPVDLSEIPFPLSVKRFYKKQNYDMVYIVGYIRGALPIMKLSNAPCVVHHHVVTDIINEPSIKGNEIVNKADRICFVSDFARDFAKTGTNEQNAKMLTFPNAIDVSEYSGSERNTIRKTIRKSIGIKDSDIVVLFVGRLVANKSPLLLIRAFNAARFEKNVKLVLCGGATYASKEITPYVKACMTEAEKNSNIIMTGYISYKDMPNYYLASDIGTLLSSCNEACGLVGIECMAAGLPVICTRRGGIPEYVSQECCVSVDDGDNFENEIKEALELLVNNENMRAQLGISAKHRSASYTRQNYYKSFCDLVEQVTE